MVQVPDNYTVLNVLECMQYGVNQPMFHGKEPLLEYFGAVNTEANAGVVDTLQKLSILLGSCPYNQLYQEKAVPPEILVVGYNDADLEWLPLGLLLNCPGWIRSVFYEYLSIIKMITNSTPQPTSLTLETKEQLDEWLQGTSSLDYTRDILYTTLDQSLFKDGISSFEKMAYGWKMDGTTPIPTFLQIVSVKDDVLDLMPVTSLGSIVLQSVFSLNKQDVVELAATGKMSVYASISNPAVKPMAQEYINSRLREMVGGESHA